ncbi:GNAT family N-acetyltransferase [Streptomyces sp. NPDC004667]|uniref:GNAT family N-acetyltransferase n=1 Tax=Streptomyces sp. NPDC004667 TaxID=3154285 RepID=UPI0033AFEB46
MSRSTQENPPDPVAGPAAAISYAPLVLSEHLEEVLAVQCRANGFDRFEERMRLAMLRGRAESREVAAVGAFSAGKLVGYAYGAPLDPAWHWARHLMEELGDTPRDRPFVGLGRPYTVLELHVDPGVRRRGVGSALMAGLCRPVSQRWILLTRDRSAVPARRFYASLGFTELAVSVRHDAYAAMGRLRSSGPEPVQEPKLEWIPRLCIQG